MDYVVIFSTLAVAIIGVKLDKNDRLLGYRVSNIAVVLLVIGSAASASIVFNKNRDDAYLSQFVNALYAKGKNSPDPTSQATIETAVNPIAKEKVETRLDPRSEAISIAKMLSSDDERERKLGEYRMYEMFDPTLLLDENLLKEH